MAQDYSLRWKSICSSLLDLIFPPICFACSRTIDDRDRFLCHSCKKELEPVEDFLCPVCGAFDTIRREDCNYCNLEPVFFDRCRSLFPYNDVVRSLIHQLKYNEMTRIADYLAKRAVQYLIKHDPFPSIDYVCPVPLHPTKLRERGYNQAALITSKIARFFSWSYRPNLVRRVKFTESQSNLSPEGRRLNVDRAFSIDRKHMLKDSNILVIDDVFTTGATANSICRMLKEHQAKKTFVLTIARA